MTHYPRYKPTALPWPDQIPDSWELVKIGAVFIERKETVSDKDFQPLSVTMDGIVPQLETAAKTDNGDNRKKVSVGDFVINSRSDRKGSSGVSNLEGSVSVISTVLKPSPKLNGKYIDYLLRNYYFKEEFYRNGKGIVADLWSTKYANMKGMQIPLPSLEEQTAIARYLDGKCALIDTFIAKKQKLIELLHEQKQAIINKAVTRGINPNVRLKPSGIEWLGEIPERWGVKKLKYLAENLNNRRVPLETEVRGRMKERHYDYYGATGIIDKVENYLFDEPTILIAEDGANLLMRNIKLVYIATGKYWVNNHAHILRPKKGVLMEYLSDLLETYDYTEHITGAAQPKLTKQAVMSINLVLPPYSEQVEIVTFIKQESNYVNDIITRIEKEIELIQEYRQSLIAEVVTGKVKVKV
jgi:type I restriction enzyme, S subunit